MIIVLTSSSAARPHNLIRGEIMAGKPHQRELVVQPQDQSIRYIALTQNKVAIVDAADYETVNQWPWFAYWSKDAKTFYAARQRSVSEVGNKCRLITMYAFIFGQKSPDHADHNGLNNTRRNLRPASRSQNSYNRRRRSDNSSGFKGVHLESATGKYIAQVSGPERREWLGRFNVAEEAARAYDRRAFELQGEFAVLNFPGEFARVA